MKPRQLLNANASVVAVTSSAATLESLLNTAAAGTHSNLGGADAIDLTVEDGDVRMLKDGNTPTATKGILLKRGGIYRFRSVQLNLVKLIRAGDANVAVSVEVGDSEDSESDTVSYVPYNLELSAGENLAANVQEVRQKVSAGIVITADKLEASGAGHLHALTFMCNDAAPTAGSLVVYDGITATGSQLFNHTFTTTPFAPFTVTLDVPFSLGLYFDFTTTADVNVVPSYSLNNV